MEIVFSAGLPSVSIMTVMGVRVDDGKQIGVFVPHKVTNPVSCHESFIACVHIKICFKVDGFAGQKTTDSAADTSLVEVLFLSAFVIIFCIPCEQIKSTKNMMDSLLSLMVLHNCWQVVCTQSDPAVWVLRTCSEYLEPAKILSLKPTVGQKIAFVLRVRNSVIGDFPLPSSLDFIFSQSPLQT